MIKVDCNLTYERIENKGSLDFWIKVCCKKCFCDFVICMFLVFE